MFRKFKPLDLVLFPLAAATLGNIVTLAWKIISSRQISEASILAAILVTLGFVGYKARQAYVTPVFHWVLIGAGVFAALAMIDEFDSNVYVIALSSLAIMIIIADLVLNENIGRTPRMRFESLSTTCIAMLFINFLALSVLGLFFNKFSPDGARLFSALLLLSCTALALALRSRKVSSPLPAIFGLLLVSWWNVALSLYAFANRAGGTAESVALVFPLVGLAFKLRRCPLPDPPGFVDVTVPDSNVLKAVPTARKQL